MIQAKGISRTTPRLTRWWKPHCNTRDPKKDGPPLLILKVRMYQDRIILHETISVTLHIWEFPKKFHHGSSEMLVGHPDWCQSRSDGHLWPSPVGTSWNQRTIHQDPANSSTIAHLEWSFHHRTTACNVSGEGNVTTEMPCITCGWTPMTQIMSPFMCSSNLKGSLAITKHFVTNQTIRCHKDPCSWTVSENPKKQNDMLAFTQVTTHVLIKFGLGKGAIRITEISQALGRRKSPNRPMLTFQRQTWCNHANAHHQPTQSTMPNQMEQALKCSPHCRG